MTPTEVLSELQKMPPVERQKILDELKENQKNLGIREKNFVNALKRKGLITEIPLGLPDDKFRQNFKRIDVKGEPISETIIKERG
ncbi:MAG: hypothetical protein M3405_04750 [Acidobacteriota bacterium]|jgi:hypothetical protein|nr:hypothetical protein [Acidobacteriota bacterium]